MRLSSRCAIAAAVFAACAAQATPSVRFAEDLNAFSTAGMPNSFAARDAFVAGLSGVGKEDFESFTAGQTFPGLGSLHFTGSGINATLSGGQVRDAAFSGRFAVDGAKYLDSSAILRLDFSAPVASFGVFVIDANENDINPFNVRVNGQQLSQQQIAARPFGTVDGVLRIVTERANGSFEVLLGAGTGASFPAGDSAAQFFGVTDITNPYTNIILVNGTAGLDAGFLDGFGYDQMLVAAAVPEPEAWILWAGGVAALAAMARRRRTGAALRG